jgi:hypothetical protein
MSRSPKALDDIIRKELIARLTAQVRELGRFVMRMESDGEAAYWRIVGPIVAGATTCRLYARPRHKLPDPTDAATRQRWPEGCLRRQRGRLEVVLSHGGIRDDPRFWWQLVSSEELRPLFTVRDGEVDLRPLFAMGSGPTFMTLRYDVPGSAIQYAKKEAADGGGVCFLPLLGREAGVELHVFAEGEAAVRLTELARAQQPESPRSAEQNEAMLRWLVGGPLDVAKQLHHELEEYNLMGRDCEKRLRFILRKPSKGSDSSEVQRALGAAELTAILERRPAARSGRAERSAEDLEQWAAQQDPLSEETVVLARETLDCLAPERAVDPDYCTPEIRAVATARWRESCEELARRLDAAVRSRRVRETAANAPAPVATRKTLDELASPERYAELSFYALRDDALALLDFLRDDTGAQLALRTTEGTLHELPASWDQQELIMRAWEGHYDDRRITDFRVNRDCIALIIWWSDVSPPPTVRERPPDPNGPHTSEWLQALTIDPLPEPSTFEVTGWGHAGLFLRGGTIEEQTWDRITETERLIGQSTFKYPTGTELKRPRYQSDGPWRAVDWTGLRRKIRQIRHELTGPLAASQAPGPRPLPVMAHATKRLAKGWALADEIGVRLGRR